MKLSVLLMVIATFQLSAINTYSQNEKLTLKMENASLVDVIKSIESLTELNFFYQNEQVSDITSLDVDANKQRVDILLSDILKSSELDFRIVDKHVVIFPDDEQVNQTTSVEQQDDQTIRGTVTDENGDPIPGVTVQVKGTQTGTVTDVEGEFSLAVTEEGETLVFSFVGMSTQEVEIGDNTNFDITMKEEDIGLDEVVVVGYGSMKKKDLTGSVSSLAGNEVAERKTTQLSEALQGSISGVTVTRNSDGPGSTADVKIRGMTTIGNSDPLVIIDGVPGSINDVNPNDIEDISVLKDAASASIYGSRAAAGVIEITTKRAESGELSLEYNADYGVETPTQLPEFVGAKRQLEMENELRWNDNGNDDNEYPTHSQEKVENYRSLHAENPDEYPITDWVGLILEDFAPRENHNLRISAGTESVRSTFSLGYEKTDGLYMGRSYERISSRFNNDVTINDFISASVDMDFKRSINKYPSVNPMYTMFISSPIFPAKWSDGRIASGKDGDNVYGQLKEGGYRNNKWNELGGKIALDITPFEGLKLSAIVSPNMTFDKRKFFRKRVEYTAPDDPTDVQGTIQNTTDLYEDRDDSHNVTSQLLANYSNSFGSHNITLMGGYENYYAYYEDLGASREEYNLTSFPYLSRGPLEYRDNSGNAWENAYRSWFGRFTYNYQERYFLQANLRYDASSRFHEDHRWGAFPSVSAGWVLTEEPFMQNVSALSFLKLRGSFGTLGNERIGTYPYQASINFSDALFYQGSNVVSGQTAHQRQYAIQDISWETTETFNVGFDAGLFDDRLQLTGDYYQKTTKDMLLAIEIPDYIGFDNPDQNTGKMETEGWELEAIYNNRIGDLNYNVSFNISDSKSVMGDLGGTEFLGSQVRMEGSQFDEWYGYVSDGIYQSEEEIENSATTSGSVRPGDIKYKDISGPDGEPDGEISAEHDRVLLGGSRPRYTYGGSVRLDYKNFDFSLDLQGVGKQNDHLQGRMIQPLPENWGSIPEIIDGNYWSHYNTEEENLQAEYPRLSRVSQGNNYTTSDFWLFDGSYLRVKNIALGYSLPQKFVDSMSMTNLRFHVTLSDIYTFNNYPKGWDPEVSQSGHPITSSVLFGASVKF